MESDGELTVAVVGAGPAGLFAANALAAKGYGIALFNRDIKPGGLAEYGIFPDKYTLRNGLRKQFLSILACENIAYFGNVHLGVGKCIEIATLFEWGFGAVLITCGAQGIKSLNLPGESLKGVFHAKDLVFHYNKLPPYASREFKFGKKVAIVGAGNVMADITHFLTNYTTVKEITAIIRRGPGEVKFDKKEMETIISYIDLSAFDREIERVSGEMVKVGQNVQAIKEELLAPLSKVSPKERNARLTFHFLASPKQIRSDDGTHVSAIEFEENQLALQDGEIVASGSGKTNVLEVDNVIFAIGDRVLDELGLPINHSGFCKAKLPKYAVNADSFEIEDPETGNTQAGIFVAGWARNPSSGLVGTARKDGVNAAEAISQYLERETFDSGITAKDLEGKLEQQDCKVVTKEHLPILEAAEKKLAGELGLEEYKFSNNEEMLKIMGLV